MKMNEMKCQLNTLTNTSNADLGLTLPTNYSLEIC